jgi:hypothetical protein
MKTLIKLEGLALFGLSIFLFSQLGYQGGTRLGAVVYNLVHHHALSLGLYILGFFLGLPLLQLAGVILLGHSNLDRALGYGLKHSDSFQNTHLGVIGK